MTDQPPPQQPCNCGNDDVQSARHGNGHLMWCASQAQRTCHATDPALAARTWTIEEMLAEGPCMEYDRERIATLWAGRQHLSLQEILALDIPPQHRLWVVWLPHVLTLAQRQMVLERVVTRAIRNHALHCGIEAVERWAVQWLSGQDRTPSACGAAIDAVLAGVSADSAPAVWGASWAAVAAMRLVQAPRSVETVTGAAMQAATATVEVGTVEATAESTHQITDVLAVLARDGADAERDRRLAAGLEATRRRLDLPPYPTREEWGLLVEYLATEEPSVFVDRIREAITAHLDTLAQADTRRALVERLDGQVDQQAFILGAMLDATKGQAVSEFALSFPAVREVHELHAEAMNSKLRKEANR